MHLTSASASSKRDVLGLALLSVLTGQQCLAHITTLRCYLIKPAPPGMQKGTSEGAVRWGFDKIDEEIRGSQQQEQPWDCGASPRVTPWLESLQEARSRGFHR
jgi:hypothetical protein